MNTHSNHHPLSPQIPLYEKMANEKYKIRKNCVEVSVALSYICSSEVREQVLVPIYLSFLKDPLKYVSDLALIALGPFIASFANSEGSEYHQTFNEVLMNNIYNFNYGPINFSLSNANFRDDLIYDIVPDYNDAESNWYQDSFKYRNVFDERTFSRKLDYSLIGGKAEEGKRALTSVSLDDEPDEEADETKDEAKDEFNSFNYWREPIMSIDELLDADEKAESGKDDDRLTEDELANRFFANLKMNDMKIKDLKINDLRINDLDSRFKMQKEDMMATNIQRCLLLLKNSEVPNELLAYFLKNLLSNYGSNIYQADINCICAFSLPAVALTLGRENWPCLRFAFNALVIGMSTNIKLILASSLHELAKIVGPFYTNLDILPALFTFMRHSDEIRERILKNLSPLVNSFEKNDQAKILRKLPQFYKLDNEYNWRFRVEFIKQFIDLVPLYDKQKQFNQIIMPMIFSLLEDKVAEVRKSSIPLLTVTIQHFYDESKKALVSSRLKESILEQLHQKLCQSKKWTFRQLYILICENIVQSVALPVDTFREKLLPPLLALAKDKVNNVRLTLARVLSSELFQKYFDGKPSDLEETVELLAGDEDKDVRSYFVTPSKEEEEAALNKENRLFKFDDLQMKIGRDLFFDERLWSNEENDDVLSSIEKLTDHIESGARSYGDSALIGSDELLSKHVSSEQDSNLLSSRPQEPESGLASDLDSNLNSNLDSNLDSNLEASSKELTTVMTNEPTAELSSEITNELSSDPINEFMNQLISQFSGHEKRKDRSEQDSESTDLSSIESDDAVSKDSLSDSVSDSVSDPLNASSGDSLGDSVSSPASDSASHSVSDSASDLVIDSVSDSTSGSAGDSVSHSVSQPANDSASESVSNPANHSVSETASEECEEKVSEESRKVEEVSFEPAKRVAEESA